MGRVLPREKKRKKKIGKVMRSPSTLPWEWGGRNKKKKKGKNNYEEWRWKKNGEGSGKKIEGKIMNENRECHVRGMGERERVDGGVGGEWKKREERENNKK